ncbi:MAG: arsenite methyltransferase [Candidatus Bathyarchaeia archaeon]
MEEKIKNYVQKKYSQIAEKNECCCSCASIEDPLTQAKIIGYSEEELKNAPTEAFMGLGCGNPTALAELKEGEVVLDLGSGAGIDVFLASKKVGSKGLAIGVDMTREMVKKARKIAKKYGYKNVEFKLGEIENLPIEDNSVDVVISNCVINLCIDKLKAFKEAYRVLKPGGRLMISDLVTNGELPEEIRKNLDAWADCIAGAMQKNEYLETIKKAGFKNITIVSEKPYYEPGMNEKLTGKILSISVKAYK